MRRVLLRDEAGRRLYLKISLAPSSEVAIANESAALKVLHSTEEGVCLNAPQLLWNGQLEGRPALLRTWVEASAPTGTAELLRALAFLPGISSKPLPRDVEDKWHLGVRPGIVERLRRLRHMALDAEEVVDTSALFAMLERAPDRVPQHFAHGSLDASRLIPDADGCLWLIGLGTAQAAAPAGYDVARTYCTLRTVGGGLHSGAFGAAWRASLAWHERGPLAELVQWHLTGMAIEGMATAVLAGGGRGLVNWQLLARDIINRNLPFG
jgi:hypothetical protein